MMDEVVESLNEGRQIGGILYEGVIVCLVYSPGLEISSALYVILRQSSLRRKDRAGEREK